MLIRKLLTASTAFNLNFRQQEKEGTTNLCFIDRETNLSCFAAFVLAGWCLVLLLLTSLVWFIRLCIACDLRAHATSDAKQTNKMCHIFMLPKQTNIPILICINSRCSQSRLLNEFIIFMIL